jgi:hypothetical protein
MGLEDGVQRDNFDDHEYEEPVRQIVSDPREQLKFDEEDDD